MHPVPTLRWKPLRKGVRLIGELLRGRRFRFARQKDRAAVPPAGWKLAGEFGTAILSRPDLGDANYNRVANMRRACEAINGVVLRPGRIFSLQHHVGEPSSRRGYLAGPVIWNGALASATGGGLCQISTTLFNAALLANLDILEKHNHSTDLWGDRRVVELGKDAAYVWLRKDLVFRNSLAWPVALELGVDDEATRLVCRIWAPATPPWSVEVRHRLLAEHPRWVVYTERVVRDARGERINFERKDVYEREG